MSEAAATAIPFEPGNPKYQTVLDREHYSSQEILEREYTGIFCRQWTFAGHVSDLPKVGDYFLPNLLERA